MTKRGDTLKIGFVLKRMLKDKKGMADTSGRTYTEEEVEMMLEIRDNILEKKYLKEILQQAAILKEAGVDNEQIKQRSLKKLRDEKLATETDEKKIELALHMLDEKIKEIFPSVKDAAAKALDEEEKRYHREDIRPDFEEYGTDWLHAWKGLEGWKKTIEGPKRIRKKYVDYNRVRLKATVEKPLTELVKIGRSPKNVISYVGERSRNILRGDWGFANKKEDKDVQAGWIFVFMTILLYLMDMFLGFNGINIQRFIDNLTFLGGVESYFGWFFNAIVITLLIAYWVLYRPGTNEFISWFLVAETISLIIFMGGMGTMLIHLAFCIAFYFLYIRYFSPKVFGTSETESHATANYIFFFLLAFDYFGYGLLAYFIDNPVIANRLIIPIWFYFALIFTHQQKRTFMISMVIFIVIMMNVFYFVGGIEGLRSMGATLTEDEKQEGINFFVTGWSNVKDTFKKAWYGFRDDLDSRLIYASGGYYQGRVERNKVGPLGVYIEELQSSQPRYYQEEDVIIWGTIKAISLGEAINLDVNCHKQYEESYATSRKPNYPFTMFNKETRDFECIFKEGKVNVGWWDSWEMDFYPFHVVMAFPLDIDGLSTKRNFADIEYRHLKLGSNTLTVDASFDFETLAYLKSYYMDLDRKRSMVREGLDPFVEFNIKDKDPIAVYTDGPVIIGMETTSPIIEVSKGAVSNPRLGVTLENKEGWDGVIEGISELVILMPPGVEIKDLDDDCTYDFKEYEKICSKEGELCCYDSSLVKDISDVRADGLNKVLEAKRGSCETLVYQPCVQTCKEGKVDATTEANCRYKRCKEAYTSCVEDCEILFEGDKEGELYNAYALDVDSTIRYWNIKRIPYTFHFFPWKSKGSVFRDIDRFRSFSCSLNVKGGSEEEGGVLENTPITVKYFRTKARYYYTLQKDIDVLIQESPGTGAEISPIKDLRDDIESPTNFKIKKRDIKLGQDVLMTWKAPVDRENIKSYKVYRVNLDILNETFYDKELEYDKIIKKFWFDKKEDRIDYNETNKVEEAGTYRYYVVSVGEVDGEEVESRPSQVIEVKVKK